MKTYEEKKAETNRLLALLPEVRDALKHIPGVERITVGMRERNGVVAQEMVFRVHVDAKIPESQLAPEHIIPRSIRGVPVDVVVKRMPVAETGFLNDDNYEGKHRPVSGGVSISAKDADAGIPGTLGCFCKRTTDDKIVFVTNWHVLLRPDGAVGNAVGQPLYRKKCCCVCDRIGSVLDFDKDLDIAIGELDSKIQYAPKIRRVLNLDSTVAEEGDILGGEAPVALDGVYKVGVRTGLTYGWISDLDPATNRVEVTPDTEFDRMSAPGDSGSVYVSSTTKKVVALHNAGNGYHGFGIPFDVVMSTMDIEVIPTPASVAYTVIERAENVASETHEMSTDVVFEQLAERLRQTVSGPVLLGIVEKHRDEIIDRINMQRRVTVTWHRAEGPAFLAAFSRSAQDDTYEIPGEVRGIARRDAVSFMANVLRETGSESLRADIDTHGDHIVRALSECANVREMLARLDAVAAEAFAHG